MIHATEHATGVTIIRPGVERLTAVNATAFKSEVIKKINDGASTLLVDFSGVTFLDSSGLGALVGVLKKIGNRGDLAVSGLTSDVAQMFSICRMDRVFTIFQDVDTGLQTMSERL